MTRHPPIATAALLVSLAAGAAFAQQRVPVLGDVVDEEGRPLPDATISFEAQRTYSATTDETGEYSLLLPAARYRIAVTREGYRGATFEFEVRTGDPNHLPTVDLASHASLAAAETAEIHDRFAEAGAKAEVGDLDAAQAMFEELRAERPDVVDAHYNLGVILARKQEWGPAEEALLAALERQPDHRAAALMLANVYQSTGRADEAIIALETLAAARPEDAEVHLNLAHLLMNDGRDDDAQAALEEVTRLAPDNADATYLLATLATRRGDYRLAVELLESYLERAPEDSQHRAAAAELLPTLKDYADQEAEASRP